MLKLAVLVSGGGTNLEAIIEAIDSGRIRNARIGIVVSNNPGAYALQRAENHGIPNCCVSPKNFETRQEFYQVMIGLLQKEKIDLVVLAGYLVNISSEMVDAFPNRIINIHPSLIPSFCGKGFYGLKVHEEVLKRGVKVTGATVHFVDNGTDTGPIILQKAVSVKTGDTPQQLQRRVMEEAEWKILPEAINLIANDKIQIIDGRVEA